MKKLAILAAWCMSLAITKPVLADPVQDALNALNCGDCATALRFYYPLAEFKPLGAPPNFDFDSWLEKGLARPETAFDSWIAAQFETKTQTPRAAKIDWESLTILKKMEQLIGGISTGPGMSFRLSLAEIVASFGFPKKVTNSILGISTPDRDALSDILAFNALRMVYAGRELQKLRAQTVRVITENDANRFINTVLSALPDINTLPAANCYVFNLLRDQGGDPKVPSDKLSVCGL